MCAIYCILLQHDVGHVLTNVRPPRHVHGEAGFACWYMLVKTESAVSAAPRGLFYTQTNMRAFREPAAWVGGTGQPVGCNSGARLP
jgi:hypothetical protein